ncbi:DNA replication and repair protein RecF [Candidatus Gottesmanbacteria bacterium]|nr:DNA replication and repair protein RecF [Candidatus Gottesmanbacteria bacterium]
MILSSLSLQNFRKFPKKIFHFSSNQTIIIGPNGIGKTNILEAIFLLATGRSFRAENDREMIEFGKETGRVSAGVNISTDENTDLEVLLTSGMVIGIKTQLKQYKLNGVPKRMSDFVGILKVVLFWPQDLELVTDSPSVRRHYLDFVLMQVDREYRRNLHSYEKGLRQRNKVLEAIRDTGAHHHQLLFWNQLLIKSGEHIIKKREEYIDYINNHQRSPASPGTGRVTINDQQLRYQLFYDKSIISQDRLDQYSREEVASANTLVGPHRDDFSFSLSSTPGIEARNLSHYGSRGEQRLGILWLKLRELAYIKETTREKPILLLDDIFSELDHERRKIIFDIIGNQQTIMTTTDLHLLEKAKIENAKMIEL